MSIPQNVIELRGAGKDFGLSGRRGEARTRALEDVSLAIPQGQFVCLLGPSGCGKSTILNLVAGFEPPTRGAVLAHGREVRGPSPGRGVVFQKPALFPWLSVLDNITFGPRMAGARPQDYLPQAREFLRRVGLKGFERHAPWQLSGGMQQRAALARAWILNPGILLMDEPFGALDAQTRMMMQELLGDIWAATRPTVLFVTHDVDEALFLADRILVMSARPGRIVEDLAVPAGRPRDIEALALDRQVGELRRHILHRVREEARQTIETPF